MKIKIHSNGGLTEARVESGSYAADDLTLALISDHGALVRMVECGEGDSSLLTSYWRIIKSGPTGLFALRIMAASFLNQDDFDQSYGDRYTTTDSDHPAVQWAVKTMADAIKEDLKS